MTTGERIQSARKQAGLSQKELGTRLGVSGSMIGQYENDLRNPKQETLQNIADALGVHISVLSPIKITIPMPDYPVRIPEDIETLSDVDQEYYYLRLLADTAPDTLKQQLDSNYDKLNKLGKVAVVLRSKELTRLHEYTEADPHNKSTEAKE